MAAPAYLARAGQPVVPQDLAQHAMISYSLLANGNELAFDGPQGHETVKFTPVLQCNNESLLHAAALDGMGIALLPSWQTDADLAAGRLVRLFDGYQLAGGKVYAVYTSRRYLSSKVRTFIDFLADEGRLGS